MADTPDVIVRVKKLNEKALMPKRGSAQAAGYDLHACIDTRRTIAPQERVLIPTGLSIALPEGWELQVRPRSGLSIKHGIIVVNSPGTVDSDYRGEIAVGLLNTSAVPFTLEPNERIAQAVVSKVYNVQYEEISEHTDTTERGEGGFGSTGRV